MNNTMILKTLSSAVDLNMNTRNMASVIKPHTITVMVDMAVAIKLDKMIVWRELNQGNIRKETLEVEEKAAIEVMKSIITEQATETGLIRMGVHQEDMKTNDIHEIEISVKTNIKTIETVVIDNLIEEIVMMIKVITSKEETTIDKMTSIRIREETSENNLNMLNKIRI